jgi:hypothetical protein
MKEHRLLHVKVLIAMALLHLQIKVLIPQAASLAIIGMSIKVIPNQKLKVLFIQQSQQRKEHTLTMVYMDLIGSSNRVNIVGDVLWE